MAHDARISAGPRQCKAAKLASSCWSSCKVNMSLSASRGGFAGWPTGHEDRLANEIASRLCSIAHTSRAPARIAPSAARRHLLRETPSPTRMCRSTTSPWRACAGGSAMNASTAILVRAWPYSVKPQSRRRATSSNRQLVFTGGSACFTAASEQPCARPEQRALEQVLVSCGSDDGSRQRA